MRGIGGEAALARQDFRVPGQQAVQRHPERMRLHGHLRGIHRGEVVGAAAGQVSRHTPHRPEGALGHHTDQQRQQHQRKDSGRATARSVRDSAASRYSSGSAIWITSGVASEPSEYTRQERPSSVEVE